MEAEIDAVADLHASARKCHLLNITHCHAALSTSTPFSVKHCWFRTKPWMYNSAPEPVMQLQIIGVLSAQ
jgi:hypothetical protein